MLRLSLRGLAARKLRTALTAFAVLLGVAMVAGTFVMGDTVRQGFSNLYTQADRGSDAVIRGRLVVKDWDTVTPALPARLVDRVRQVPGVAAAEGSIEGRAQLLARDGSVIGGNGPQFAVSVQAARFSPLHVTSGRFPSGPGEVAVDAITAGEEGWRLGQEVRVATSGAARAFRLVGTTSYQGVDTHGATFAVFDLRTAQSFLGKRGEVDKISVVAAPGIAPAELVRRLQRAGLRTSVPLAIKTQRQDVHDTAAEDLFWAGVLGDILLAFGGIALFVGAFIIFNTFSITVAQRRRELAVLRMVGASGRQVLRGVLLEALWIGLGASLLGAAAGLGLGRGIFWLFSSLGLDLPKAALVVSPRTPIVGIAVGVVVTLLAALVPAIRAVRVPPMAALRDETGASEEARGAVLTVVAAVLLAASVLALGYGTIGHPGSTSARLLLAGGGSVALFVATALLLPRLIGPAVAALGWPLRRVAGVPARLASENAVRNPGRTAATAAALMVGLALVAFVTVFAKGLAASAMRQVNAVLPASTYTIAPSDDGGRLSTAVARKVAGVPGVGVVSPIAKETSRIAGRRHTAFGIDPRTLGRVYRFHWQDGSPAVLAHLGARDVLMERGVARAEHLRVGQRFRATTPLGRTATLRLAGIYRDDFLATGYLLRKGAFRALFGGDEDASVLAAPLPGASGPGVQRAIERRLAHDFPGVKVQSRKQVDDRISSDVSSLVALFYALLGLSVLISIFGIVNTLVLATLERTRELGMLRAIGTSRRQVRRMVRYESVLTSVIGAAVGLGLGVFLAWIVTRALEDDGFRFSLPSVQLAGFVVFACVVGVVAAILPARRAARLDVLEALSYE